MSDTTLFFNLRWVLYLSRLWATAWYIPAHKSYTVANSANVIAYEHILVQIKKNITDIKY